MIIVAQYIALTNDIASALGGSRQLAHVHGGLAIYVAMQFITRDRRASLNGLFAVAGVELANEIMEAAYYQSFRWADTICDIALTLAWPMILYNVGQRRRRQWIAARMRSPGYSHLGPLPELARQ